MNKRWIHNDSSQTEISRLQHHDCLPSCCRKYLHNTKVSPNHVNGLNILG